MCIVHSTLRDATTPYTERYHALRIAIHRMRTIYLTILLVTILSLNGKAQDKWSTYDYLNCKISDTIQIDKLENYSVFLAGGIHTVSSSPQTKIDLLKYLYRNGNVRNLIIESGYASSFLINRYLDTGDASYICKDVNYHPHKEYRQFWRELYDFNKTVTQSIKVIGIDDNERLSTWFKALETIFTENATLNSAVIDSIVYKVIQASRNIHNPLNLDVDYLHVIKSDFIDSFNEEKKIYQDILKDNFKHLELIITNDISIDRTKNTNRLMYENLMRIIKKDVTNTGNYFGQFGSAHIGNYHRSLSTILDKEDNSPFRLQVMTIFPYYKNCQYTGLEIEGDTYLTNTYEENSKFSLKIDSPSIYTLIKHKEKRGRTRMYALIIKNKNGLEFIFPNDCK